MSIPAMLSANDMNISKGTVQDAEGNTYRTVQIGEQTWFAENLKSTKFRDGSAIRTAFIPGDDEKNLLEYGRLYDWHDVSDQRGICPDGWRVATDTDWKKLERTIGMSEDDLDKEGWRGDNNIALTLKAAQPDTMFSKLDQSQVNKHNFFARPAGIKWKNWYFVRGMYAEFWTSSEATEGKAYNRTLAYSCWNPHKGDIIRTTHSKNFMFSARCVKE